MADSTVYLGWQYPIEQYVHVIVFCVVENSIVALTRAAGDGDTCYLHPKLLFSHSLAQGNRGNGNHSLSLFSLATMIVSWMKQSNELFDCNLVHSLFHLLFHINGSKCKCFIHQFHSDGSTEKKGCHPWTKESHNHSIEMITISLSMTWNTFKTQESIDKWEYLSGYLIIMINIVIG